MVLIRALALSFLLLIGALSLPPQAGAHKNEQHERVEQEQAVAPAPGMSPDAIHGRMAEQGAASHQQAPSTFVQRLMSWIGRTHPFAVHFPIALFPVALVALVLARRRGETVELIRALIIVAGAAALIAGILGWLTAGFALVDRDPLHLWHRWIGTALAMIGAVVALWAWRRRKAVDSGVMMAALAIITLALLVQGWLGAALVHGMEHMMF